MYKITASYDRNGTRTDTSTDSVLGDAYGQTYPTREAAQAVADGLQASIADYDLDASTEYQVVAA